MSWVVGRKYLHTLFQLVVLVVFYKRGTHAQTFLMGTCGDEADGRNTIVHQLFSQLTTGHSLIANGEIETVGNGLIQVLVVYDVEVVAKEDFLQLMGAVAINLHLVAEIIGSVTGSFQHSRHSILGRVAGTRREGIEHSGGEYQSEGQSFVTGTEVSEMTMVKTAANAGVEAVAKKVVELTDEQANALVEKLSE